MDVIVAQFPLLCAATWLTIWMFVLVTAISTLLGAMLAVAADAFGAPVATPLAVYGWIFRGTPELIVLLACYLGLPALGINLDPVEAAILAFTLIGVAFQFEIFRGGLAGINRQQREAARALGMAWNVTMRRIVLPQVFAIVLPAWTTFSAGFIKAFAVASAISVAEIMGVTRRLMAISNEPFVLIAFAGAIYAAISSVLMIAELLTGRAAKFGARPVSPGKGGAA